ncbi:hypothetical protein CR513_21737, partial [Mucuna pruriens]
MTSSPKEDLWWVLYVDGSSNPKGGGWCTMNTLPHRLPTGWPQPWFPHRIVLHRVLPSLVMDRPEILHAEVED